MSRGIALSLVLLLGCPTLVHPFLAGRYACGKLSGSAIRAAASVRDAALIEEIRAMRASQMKTELKQAGVNVNAVFEKDELAELLYVYRSTSSRVSTTQRKSPSKNSVQLLDAVYEDGPKREGQFVPESMDKPYLAVKVEVQGRTLRFLLDTGATDALIGVAAVRALNLPYSKTVANAVGGSGEHTTFPIVTVSGALLGSKTLSFIACVMTTMFPLPQGIDGILGISTFQQLGGVVLFDFENRVFSWGSTMDEVLPADRLSRLSKVRFHRKHQLMGVDMEVDGVGCVGLVDLGASYTVCNEALVRATGRQTGALARDVTGAMGIDGRMIECRVMPRCALALGSIAERRDLRVMVGMTSLDRLGLGSVPAVVLGVDVLRRKCLLIDLNTRTVALG